MGFIMEKENSFKDAATHYEAAWRYSNKVMELLEGVFFRNNVFYKYIVAHPSPCCRLCKVILNTIKVVLLAFYFQTMDKSAGKGDMAKY